MGLFLDIVNTALEVGAAVSLSARITRWVEQDAADGDDAVRQFVQAASVEWIDAMDEAFFHYLRGAMLPTQKLRVLRLYAYFKVVEYARFKKFRGFPAVS